MDFHCALSCDLRHGATQEMETISAAELGHKQEVRFYNVQGFL